MLLLSRARFAGAESVDRKPVFGFEFFSHSGQTGQSLLLKNLCPFLQIFKILFNALNAVV